METKHIISILGILLLSALCGQAQTNDMPNGRQVVARSQFFGYSTREATHEAKWEDENQYIVLSNLFTTTRNGRRHYRTVVEIPGYWRDRTVFLHTEGGRNAHNVYVNDIFAGSARDSRLPSEFDITEALKDGMNVIAIEIADSTAEPESTSNDPSRPEVELAYLYAQPELRIEDYDVSFIPDSTGRFCLLSLDIALANSRNYEEAMTVGYDIYAPNGDLKYYDLRETVIAGHGRDTIHFETPIYSAMQQLWSDHTPRLYTITLYTKRGQYITEYIPFRIGAGSTAWNSTEFLRNGKPVALSTVRYNAAPTPQQTRQEIIALKKEGSNTLCPDYPQPVWFYDLCDQLGMYVIDQANINTDRKADDRRIGGTLSNDPRWLDDYLERVERMYRHSHNHTCIIGWSLGGKSGNGYNMYKAYRLLKSLEKERPVIYRDAAGEWNSDMELTVPERQK